MDDASALKKIPNYAASPQLSSLVKWQPGESGHILIQKETMELFIAVAVVQVYDFKLNCGPNGNFIKGDFGSLEKAKFQMYTGRPADPLFGDDFSKLYTNLTKLQNEIASTNQHHDMLYLDASAKMIRFARTIFEKRDTKLSDSPPVTYYEDLTGPNPRHTSPAGKKDMIDEETRNWPIEEKYRDALHLIAPTHKAVPLRVYNKNTFIEPADVNNTLRNSIIEVHFSLHHTYLSKNSRDSFRANIEQIIVLKPGKSIQASYSKTDIRAGPVSAFSTSIERRKRGASLQAESSKPTKHAKASELEHSSQKGKRRADENAEESTNSSDTMQHNDV